MRRILGLFCLILVSCGGYDEQVFFPPPPEDIEVECEGDFKTRIKPYNEESLKSNNCDLHDGKLACRIDRPGWVYVECDKPDISWHDASIRWEQFNRAVEEYRARNQK